MQSNNIELIQVTTPTVERHETPEIIVVIERELDSFTEVPSCRFLVIAGGAHGDHWVQLDAISVGSLFDFEANYPLNIVNGIEIGDDLFDVLGIEDVLRAVVVTVEGAMEHASHRVIPAIPDLNGCELAVTRAPKDS